MSVTLCLACRVTGKRRRRAESEPAPATEALEEGDASSAEEGGASVGGRRAAARRRMMWTPELHARFMNAVNYLVGRSGSAKHDLSPPAVLWGASQGRPECDGAAAEQHGTPDTSRQG